MATRAHQTQKRGNKKRIWGSAITFHAVHRSQLSCARPQPYTAIFAVLEYICKISVTHQKRISAMGVQAAAIHQRCEIIYDWQYKKIPNPTRSMPGCSSLPYPLIDINT